MTTTVLRTVWPRTWPRAFAAISSSMLVTLAWVLGLWLVVVGAVVAAITVVVAESLRDRELAQRAATWALFAPHRCSGPDALERVVAADMAALAHADARVLVAASALVERTVDDVWLRALAGERLDAAGRLVASQDIPHPRVRWDLAVRCCLLVGPFVMASAVVAAATTRHPISLVVLGAALGVTTPAWSERRRRASLPSVLAHEATMPPVSGPFVIPEDAVALALVSLADGRTQVLSLAADLLDTARSDDAGTAQRRLSRAGWWCVSDRPSASRSLGVWMAATAVAVLLAEVAT